MELEKLARKCRKRGVGRLRAELERAHPANVVPLFEDRAAVTTAREALARICRGCALPCGLAGK